MKSKKNIIIILSLTLTAFSIVGLTDLKKKNEELTNKVTNYEERFSSLYLKLNSLNNDTFEKMVDENKEFYVYIGRPDCGDCTMFEPIMEDVIDKYGLENMIYYVNIKDIHKDSKSWENFKSKYGLKYTPTLAKFKNGKVENLAEWTRETGFTKKMVNEWVNLNSLNTK